MTSLQEFRKRRAQAGELLSLAARGGPKRVQKALKVYNQWKKGKITFEEAKEKIKQIIDGARSRKKSDAT